MNALKPFIAAIVLVAPLMAGHAAEAKTSFQYWAQGRGAYVSSKERLTTYEDDLAALRLAPPPPRAYRPRGALRQDELQEPTDY